MPEDVPDPAMMRVSIFVDSLACIACRGFYSSCFACVWGSALDVAINDAVRVTEVGVRVQEEKAADPAKSDRGEA